MSASDRDLVAALRAELAAIDPQRACDRVAESAGLGPGLVTREASIARLAVRLGRETEAGVRPGIRRRAKHVRITDTAIGPGRPDGGAATWLVRFAVFVIAEIAATTLFGVAA